MAKNSFIAEVTFKQKSKFWTCNQEHSVCVILQLLCARELNYSPYSSLWHQRKYNGKDKEKLPISKCHYFLLVFEK